MGQVTMSIKYISRRSILLLTLTIGMICAYYYMTVDSTEILFTIYKTPDLSYKVINMNDRTPAYRLATLNGRRPYADGDRAQATVVEHLRLLERCQRDPSLVVVDVGAYLGDFGLYAAACGCQVYLFEVQPDMIDLIQTSINVNDFPSSRVQLVHKAVTDLPSNSNLTFSIAGGSTTAANGTLSVSTIRLDDIQWPLNSKIFLLKIDVEGFELHVLRSAQNLFRNQRIQHVIFEYTAFWTDRAAQKEVLPYVDKKLGAKNFYVLHRTRKDVYGPLDRDKFDEFYEIHTKRCLQTDVYATFIDLESNDMIKTKEYDVKSTLA
ncbi:unnamed protein product [Adineta ricciae]|uniref:Methyltransferase FkbM domain-containing protein n=2 Tax=Adineta ricciae TaxID=249248 RepID=A0A813SFK4_ADIRI|nr:unnamed protein product [Adineta ricciae]